MSFVFILLLLLLPACKPTYQKETIKESVKALAQKEYQLDVDVVEAGTTLGLRFKVKNLLSELYSGDEQIYKKMNGLFTVLARVALSVDAAPQFIVLDILDEDNPRFHLVFTRYVEDLRKSMAEALSYSQTQDRLLEEFVIGDRHVPFDPQEMDLVRLLMMAMDSPDPKEAEPTGEFVLEPIDFRQFVSRVVENYLRRLLREKKTVSKEALLRQVTASFEPEEGPRGKFKIFLDVVSQPSAKLSPLTLETLVLPLVAEEAGDLFKSYRFHDFSGITVVEKNSGKNLSVPAQ